MRVQLAILVMLGLVHTSVAPRPVRTGHSVKPIPVPPWLWTEHRSRFRPGVPRLEPKCPPLDNNKDSGVRYAIDGSRVNRPHIYRTIKHIKEVPGWVAKRLSTSDLLPTLDEKTSTRIMGLGFKTSSGSCKFPIEAESEHTGTFFYIADVEEKCNSYASIWTVLSELLADKRRELETLQKNNDLDIKITDKTAVGYILN